MLLNLFFIIIEFKLTIGNINADFAITYVISLMFQTIRQKPNMSGKPEDDKTPVIETDDFDWGLIWRPTPDSGDEN